MNPPKKIWEILEKLQASTGLPIAATKFDIKIPNYQLQAEYNRDFLTAWFAHPAPDPLNICGFWAGAHWFG